MLFLAAMFSVLVPATYQQCLTADDSSPRTSQDARQALIHGQHEFSLSMLNTVNAQSQGSNIFFSPFSVYQAMLLAYFVSANQTEGSLKRTLFLPESQDKLSTIQAYRLEKYFQKMRAVNGSSSYELSSANRLFVSPAQRIRDCMQMLFNEEVESLDFARDPDAAASRINSWVAAITKNNILDLIPAGRLSGNTQLVLANAAYFKGLWKSKFLTENSRREVFHINSSKKVLVTMMRQKGTFNYLASEKLGAHVLELPYKGDDISMFVLLPPYASPNGITNLLKRLNHQAFHEIVDEDSMIPRSVEVGVPKFTIEKEAELIPILETMGVGDLFKGEADLSGLTGEPGIQLNDAVHKAKIQVDEEGTVAAAATALFTFRSSRPLDPAIFICNHPFVYLIYDKVSQNVLFVGVYNSPPEHSSSA